MALCLLSIALTYFQILKVSLFCMAYLAVQVCAVVLSVQSIRRRSQSQCAHTSTLRTIDKPVNFAYWIAKCICLIATFSRERSPHLRRGVLIPGNEPHVVKRRDRGPLVIIGNGKSSAITAP